MANNRRNPIFTVPGGGGPVNPRGVSPLTPEPNIITYQFQINPIADRVSVDTVRDAFMHAIGHGLPQILAFRTDDGVHWFQNVILVADPHHQTASSDASHTIQVTWAALSDYLDSPATPGTAVYGQHALYGMHTQYGAKAQKVTLTAANNLIVLDNQNTDATATTTDPIITLTGPFGSTQPTLYPIQVFGYESGVGVNIWAALISGDTLLIDLSARRVTLNKNPAFGLVTKLHALQTGYFAILPNIVNNVIVQLDPRGTAAGLGGQASFQWKPKRSL